MDQQLVKDKIFFFNFLRLVFPPQNIYHEFICSPEFLFYVYSI